MSYRNCFFITDLSELSVFVVDVWSDFGKWNAAWCNLNASFPVCFLFAEFCPWWTPGVWVSETFFLNGQSLFFVKSKSTLVRLLFPVKKILEIFQTFMESPSDWSFRVTFFGLNVIGLQVYVYTTVVNQKSC